MKLLPNDTIYQIFKHITLFDLINKMLVCKQFYNIYELNSIWDFFLNRDYAFTQEQISELWYIDYKNTYKNIYKLYLLKHKLYNSVTIFELFRVLSFDLHCSKDIIIKEIDCLIYLKSLVVYNYAGYKIPIQMYNLINLRYLNLAYVLLVSLEPEIGNLTQLEILELSSNKLTSIPSTIGNLTKLTKLYLNNNKLTDLLPEICNLVSLDTLTVNNNMLKIIPYEIGNLKELKTLYLYGNKLKTIPKEIGYLTQLQNLTIDDDIIEIPVGINKSIISYYH